MFFINDLAYPPDNSIKREFLHGEKGTKKKVSGIENHYDGFRTDVQC